MKSFTTFQSNAIPLLLSDIDTDMIIPAEFLTQTSKNGYGEHLFCRLKEENSEFIFNQVEYIKSKILIAGSNFGCGSSREHAVWALLQAGIQVIIAPSFSDIFFNNAAKNGLLLISLDDSKIQSLSTYAKNYKNQLTIDLSQQTIEADNVHFKFEYDSFRKECLLKGLDDMSYLLNLMPLIKQFEDKQEYKL